MSPHNVPIKTSRAPVPFDSAPYSQAIVANGLVFCSGQIPLDPATQDVVPGTIKEQTERVLENLKAVLEDAGSKLACVCKTTVFLCDIDDIVEMNDVYSRYFPGPLPARSTVEVTRLPGGSKIEIEAIATVE